MDETQIASILSAFDTKLATDPQIRAILRKITGGKANFADTADYAIRAGNLLGQFLSGEILDISPEDREVLCAALLKNRYTDLNKLLGTVQRAQDKPLGISLNPIKAPFPTERVQQVAHSLLDPGVKPEVIRRRANAPVATVAKSFHDDYIKVNSKLRSDLGLKPILQRFGTDCCAWCAAVAGKWRFGDQPNDVFRRHDNCDCVIIYDTQVLRGEKTEGGGRSKKWVEVDPEEVMQNASEPTVLSQDAAESLQNAALGRLTLAGNRDIMRVADSGSIYHKITDESIQKVPLVDMFGDEGKNKRYQEANKALLREAQKHKPGVEVSIVYDTDMKPINGYGYVVGEVGHVTIQNPGIPFHAFHNHGSGETLSYSDIRCIVNNSSCLSITATGNTGKVYSLMKTEQSDSFGYGCFLRNKSKNVIFSAGESDFTLEKIADEETRKELMLIADKLQPEQKTALADAILSQTEKCLKGGAKYGYKYSENTP